MDTNWIKDSKVHVIEVEPQGWACDRWSLKLGLFLLLEIMKFMINKETIWKIFVLKVYELHNFYLAN
jgi:hypothetical protein